ncbi:MAG TPA: hypothetical protein ENI33_07145 [Thermoplasmatales archaeon]|nr:hypothetical protein [Thermoplasmatales archaeon]
MKNIIVSSMDEKSGKTVVAYAIAKMAKRKIGYMKPIGDNVIYKDKKVLDYDAMLFNNAFKICDNPEELCMGIHHSKILHFYKDVGKEFMRRYEKIGRNKDLFIIEGGEFFWKGASVSLDAFSIAEKIPAEIVFVVSGEYHEIMDEIYYIKRMNELPINGIILNKTSIQNAEKFIDEMNKIGIKFLGYIPYIKKLRAMKIRYIVEKMAGNVVAGEKGLDKYAENFFIAALSASEIKRHPDFKKENKLIITGGDRSDVITACIEEKTSGIILTNNIVPSSNILAKANEMNIPIISVRPDTYTISKFVENIQPVILPDEKNKLNEIEKMAKNIQIDEIIEE